MTRSPIELFWTAKNNLMLSKQTSLARQTSQQEEVDEQAGVGGVGLVSYGRAAEQAEHQA